MKTKKKSKNSKSSNFTTYLLIFIFIIGLSLLLYPTVSNYWNSFHQSKAIASYVEKINDMDDETYEKTLNLAINYNASLLTKANPFSLNDQQNVIYNALLNVGGDGLMGYIEIPSIDVSLPIYHGTSEGVLQIATGHLEWTSLPVGGESAHCVISGHRGLPSAMLFTDLDKLVVGDIFILNVLKETLTYEVDQILIVDPGNVNDLVIQEGEDLCTLVTCTPYGINSHRMLVRGHRVANSEDTPEIRIVSEAMQVDAIFVAPFFAIPMLLILLILLLVGKRSRKSNRGSKAKEGLGIVGKSYVYDENITLRELMKRAAAAQSQSVPPVNPENEVSPDIAAKPESEANPETAAKPAKTSLSVLKYLSEKEIHFSMKNLRERGEKQIKKPPKDSKPPKSK